MGVCLKAHSHYCINHPPLTPPFQEGEHGVPSLCYSIGKAVVSLFLEIGFISIPHLGKGR